MFHWKAEIEGDRIRFLGEEYPLGHFCLELLQHARVHDAAARVGVLWDFLDQYLKNLQSGLILQKQIIEIHDTIARVLPDLETLPPFHLSLLGFYFPPQINDLWCLWNDKMMIKSWSTPTARSTARAMRRWS